LRSTLIVFALALALAGAAHADESRKFQVSVDNKPAGQYQLKVVEKDGSVESTTSIRVEVKHLLGSYKYAADSKETWKDGKLLGLKSTCNDDGTKHELSMTSDGTNMTLTADGRTVKGTTAVYPTTYWSLPPVGNLTLVDSDTGKLIPAKLEKVGAEKVRFLGKEQEATKYRLTGGVDITLWYDANNRLVRETFVETGHRTTMELTEQSDN
jgi:hypothetical protein